MRITIDIDSAKLRAIQKITGQRKKSPAVGRALAQFIRQDARRRLLERALAGKTDFPLTNDELEARDVYEARR